MKNSEILAGKKIVAEGTWYHCIDFEGSTSKGTFDYRNLIYDLNIPDMSNNTVLDVGCSDGFFTLHFLKKLNAKKVTGVDINKYDGSIAFEVLNTYEDDYKEKYNNQNDFNLLIDEYKSLGLDNPNKFLLLKKIFSLNTEFVEGSIYDLSHLNSHDITFCGSLLEHLRDPITAIEQMYLKTNKFCLIDVSNSFNSSFFSSNKNYLKYTGSGGNFYHYSTNAVKSMMENIGFKEVKIIKKYKIKIEKYGYKIPHFLIIGYK